MNKIVKGLKCNSALKKVEGNEMKKRCWTIAQKATTRCRLVWRGILATG
jgi:hypothetical protein